MLTARLAVNGLRVRKPIQNKTTPNSCGFYILTLAIEVRCSEEQKVNMFNKSTAGNEHGTA